MKSPSEPTASEYLCRPRRSPNVRAASWIFAIPMNLVGASRVSIALSAPAANQQWMFNALVVVGAIFVFALSIRWVRISVSVVDGMVRIRNLDRTYKVPLAEVDEAKFGYAPAGLASQRRSGSIVTKDGKIFRVMAISDGSLVSDGGNATTARIVDSLNSLARAAE